MSIHERGSRFKSIFHFKNSLYFIPYRFFDTFIRRFTGSFISNFTDRFHRRFILYSYFHISVFFQGMHPFASLRTCFFCIAADDIDSLFIFTS